MSVVRVLVVEASPLLREVLARGLANDPGIEVVGTASDAFEARDKIVQLRPHVMTLDTDLPRMNGLEFLKRLIPQYPMPVVMVAAPSRQSSKVNADCMEAGAVEYIEKPAQNRSADLDAFCVRLVACVKRAAQTRFPTQRRNRRTVKVGPTGAAPLRTDGTLIAIGSSTGGVEALRTVLTMFPEDVPGIVVVQHMPDTFTGPLAQNLDRICAFRAKEAKHGDVVRPGWCLLAPGDQQLRLYREGGKTKVALSNGPKVDGHRPSVTVMMQSVAEVVGRKAAGAILTGMGRDGATGLLAMRKAGAHTVVQDEETSVVYGMPKVAYEIGAARYQLPLSHIANSLLTPFRQLEASS
ncbi:MAG: chemotaxis response regulator protein-glutamate methylesterase [Myxococcota bacterium]